MPVSMNSLPEGGGSVVSCWRLRGGEPAVVTSVFKTIRRPWRQDVLTYTGVGRVMLWGSLAVTMRIFFHCDLPTLYV